jgi:uncharacterized protein (TIGR00255 family)
VIPLLSSMTGYGKQTIENNAYRVSVEMRSVNNRFLDITLKMPRNFYSLEDKIKKIIQQYVKRGKVEVFVSVMGSSVMKRNLSVDWDLMDQYRENIKEIKNRYAVKGDLSVTDLLRMDEVFIIEEKEQEDDLLKETLLQAVEKASQDLLEMRQGEGQFLKNDIMHRIKTLNEIIQSLETIRPQVTENYRERIKNRLDEHLTIYDTIADDSRVIQEVALLAEKGDISEELTRLKSHLTQMEKTLNQSGRIGRKLDFICQEMHREANTIGSKATATEMNELDIELKTEIEKIKEQVQNIISVA